MSKAHTYGRTILCALGILTLAAILGPISATAANTPLPPSVPSFYDPDNVFDEAQTGTLARDAQLLQSSNIPILVVVRVASGDEAGPDAAQNAADDLRQQWQATGGPDASISLVLLYSHVPDDIPAGSLVASWGNHTFDHSGLTPDYIDSVLIRDPRSLLNDGHPFEALVYGMREIRYGGIYFPPSPTPLTGARIILHNALTWMAPVVAISSVGVLLAACRPALRARRRLIASIVGAVTLLLAVVSVIGQNRIGIFSTLVMTLAIAISCWLWGHATTRSFSVPRRQLLLDLVLVILLFAVSLGANLHAIPSTPTHPDESRWLNRAYYARDLGDPFGATWQDYVTTRGQPPLGSIVMGIGLAVQGKSLDSVKSWDFAYGRDWNTWMGANPSNDIRTAGRRTNAVIGALVVASIYILGRLLTNRVGGALGALFLAFHPLHIMLSTQALSDQTLALLLALIFLTGWWFAKQPSWTRAILLGVLLGLGGAVKLTPLLLSGPLAAFGVLRLIVDRDRAARDYALKLVLQPIIALATFIAIYPYLWAEPIRRTWNLYAFRAAEMGDQGAAWPDAAVSSPLDALGRFGAYLASTSTTRHIFGWMGWHSAPAGLDYIPAVAGLVILLWWVIKRRFWTPEAMVALLMGVEAGTLVFGMKTDFYRYHLPIVVIMAVCITISLGMGWAVITRCAIFVRDRRHAREPAVTSQAFANSLEPRS